MTSEQGSITVFMTFIFLLLFALLGVTLDSARFFGSRGLVKTSAYGADITLFGKYNRELFREYGLLAYGGYDGRGAEKWREEFDALLSRNLMERPEEEEGTDSLPDSFASVYRLGDVTVLLEDFASLSDEEEFLRQIGIFLKDKTVRDVSSRFLQGVPEDVSEMHRSLSQGFDALLDNQAQQEGGADGGSQEKAQRKGDEGHDGSKGKSQQAQEGKSTLGKEQASDGQATGDHLEKKENPLEFIRELVRNGILSLVCNGKKLYEGEVAGREGSVKEENVSKGTDWCGESSGVKVLRKFLDQEEPLLQNVNLQNLGKKGKLIRYASQVFDCYTGNTGSSVPYGLEFLVSGKRNQKDAFAAVVNRLFLIRTMLNYAYVGTSPSLQEESLVTATAIAGPLAAGALIPAIQQGILLVLALEEACVDVTALLDGKCVPVVKNQGNFQMQYQEICMANKKFFKKKASLLPAADTDHRAGNTMRGVSYQQYLYLLQMSESRTKLYSRSLDLIQQDLRQRYNQTFTVSQCISQTRVRMEYSMPLLTPSFLVRSPESAAPDREQDGLIWQDVEMSYGY